MKQIKILSRVDENGNLKRNRKFIADAIKSFSGKEIEIIIKRKYKMRSISENKYYWGVVIIQWQMLIFEEWGESYSKEEMHEFLKINCNYKYQTIKGTGEEIKIPQSTAQLQTVEFEDYLERCRRKAFEYFNTIIPLPNEQLKFEI